MENMNPDQARTIREFLLPTIEAEHKVTRMLIQAVPAEALDFKPDPGGKTMSDLMWYLLLAEHHSLAGICDAQFAAPPQRPDRSGAEAVLAWDDEHFPQTCQRLSQLSGEDLLRPVEFLGSTRPAIEFLPLSMSLIFQHRGQLAAYLRMSPASAAPKPAEEAKAAQNGGGELGESELATAVGGAAPPFQTVTLVSWGPAQYAQQQAKLNAANQGQGGLLSGLLQGGSPAAVIASSFGIPVGLTIATGGTIAGLEALQAAQTAAFVAEILSGIGVFF